MFNAVTEQIMIIPKIRRLIFILTALIITVTKALNKNSAHTDLK